MMSVAALLDQSRQHGPCYALSKASLNGFQQRQARRMRVGAWRAGPNYRDRTSEPGGYIDPDWYIVEGPLCLSID